MPMVGEEFTFGGSFCKSFSPIPAGLMCILAKAIAGLMVKCFHIV